MSKLDAWQARRAFVRQRAAFFSDTAMVLGDVRLRSILALLIKNNQGSPLGRAFADIDARFGSGEPMSDAFGEYLPNAERLALRGWDAAKSDKELAGGFQVLGQLASAFGQIHKAAMAAAVQAIGSLLLVLVLLFTMFKQVYPSLTAQFPVEKWWVPARFVYYLINTMFANLLVFAAVLAVLVAAYIWSLSRWTSPLRRRLDSTLLYSWYRSLCSLQVLLALALHLKAKRGVNTSLKLVMQQSGAWQTWYLEEMLVRNEEGREAGQIFDVGFFDKSIMNRILLLSANGSVDVALDSIAFTSQKELLDEFRQRIALMGVTSKNIALVIAVIPVALFFLTIGDFITHQALGSFKGSR